MANVQCLYCGKDIEETAAACPHCGARSHFQKQGENPWRQRRFRIYVILLTLFCLAMALWLPR